MAVCIDNKYRKLLEKNMYYTLGLLSFILTACFINMFHKPAKIIGLVDKPSCRKTHCGNIPLTGGLSIFCSISVITYLHKDLFGASIVPCFQANDL